MDVGDFLYVWTPIATDKPMHQLATAVASNQVCEANRACCRWRTDVRPSRGSWLITISRVIARPIAAGWNSTALRPSVRPSARPPDYPTFPWPIKHRRLPADLLADDNQNNYLLSIVLRRRRHQFISIGPLPRETRVYVSNKDRSTATKQNNSQRIVRALSVIQPLPETGNAQIGMTYLLQFYT